ncbi:MAG: bifunctional phosphopantothenoylcysteine decarboxylase/phosphopantothenate--cysteine ligase CoaBC [Thermoplasmata archaeon]|nr:bifunctional phosphopantothenoylcysteine decarboxylase/phosphopantothenate--cysteine ligase CoaBC [Thermoplasmata archaeon]
MHPSKDIEGIKSDKLSGKKIVLGVTGSIAAVETVKLARELIRHGATVIPVMTKAAMEIISAKSLHFATGFSPITEITGSVEHVMYCGARPERADLLLIAPATGNTISKIACGIDDTPVTTFATTAIGTGIPVLVVPAMHETMYAHPVIQDNIAKLEKLGIHILRPKIAEHKAKFPEIEEIVAHVIRLLGKRDYAGKRVLVIGGASYEPLDDMRILTNLSSGKMSVALVREAFLRGAEVDFLAGRIEAPIPQYIPTTRFTTVEDLLGKLANLDYDYIFVPAALSDFCVDSREGKMPSDREHRITLKPLPKVIKRLREESKGVIVGFKAEPVMDEKTLVSRAFNALKTSRIDFICANTIKNAGSDAGQIIILDRKGKSTKFTGTKEKIAEKILDIVRK